RPLVEVDFPLDEGDWFAIDDLLDFGSVIDPTRVPSAAEPFALLGPRPVPAFGWPPDRAGKINIGLDLIASDEPFRLIKSLKPHIVCNFYDRSSLLVDDRIDPIRAFDDRVIRVMRPDAEAPRIAAHEVGVEICHPEVVDGGKFPGVLHPLD